MITVFPLCINLKKNDFFMLVISGEEMVEIILLSGSTKKPSRRNTYLPFPHTVGSSLIIRNGLEISELNHFGLK